MEAIVTNPHFKNVGIPLISIVLTIGLKVCSKRKMTIELADFAIGLELFITAVALLLTGIIELGFESAASAQVMADLVNAQGMISAQKVSRLHAESQAVQDKLAQAGLYLFMLMLAIFTTAMVVRGVGWDAAGKRLNWFGLYFPTFLGVVLLFFVSSWVTGGIG